MLPRGSRKLQALHTLRDVDLVSGAGGILREIKRLTGLQKLGLISVTKENGQKVCSVISKLSHLESLSMKSGSTTDSSSSSTSSSTSDYIGYLYLSDISSPPKNLQSLKLEGSMHELPGWICELQNLVKLKLNLDISDQLEHAAAIEVLGKLPNLSILCLQGRWTSWSPSLNNKEHHFKSGTFKSLRMLELKRLGGTKSINFEQGAMPELEHLKYWDIGSSEVVFSGLEFLRSIKKVVVDYECCSEFDDRSEAEVVAEFENQFRVQIASHATGHKIVLLLDVRIASSQIYLS